MSCCRIVAIDGRECVPVVGFGKLPKRITVMEGGWYGTSLVDDTVTVEHDYVMKRTCRPKGEWERISHTQWQRVLECTCGEVLGTDQRDSFFGTRLARLPNYCSNCGARVDRPVARGNHISRMVFDEIEGDVE